MISKAKTILLAAALGLAPISAAQADNDIGCGVGTMVFEGKQGPHFKILASMLNGIAMQSVSITFGLVNCGSLNDTITAGMQTRHFIASSMDNLSRDVAMGGGESLDTLAALLELDETKRDDFGRFTQAHYEQLFPSGQVTSDEVLDTLDRLMLADERFAPAAPSARS